MLERVKKLRDKVDVHFEKFQDRKIARNHEEIQLKVVCLKIMNDITKKYKCFDTHSYLFY